jgi:hypothetical protein
LLVAGIEHGMLDGAAKMDSHPSQQQHIPDGLARYLNELRVRVHRYRRYGILPERCGRLRLRARRGSGRTCLLCGEPILASEPEIILEHDPGRARAPETPTYRLHHLCHIVWLTESQPARSHKSAGGALDRHQAGRRPSRKD